MNDEKNVMGPAMGGEMIGGQATKGPTIGAVIVIIVLVIGAIYIFWKRNFAEPTPEPLPAEETSMVEADRLVDALTNQSVSDEVGALEVDAAATDLGSLDSELNNPELESTIN